MFEITEGNVSELLEKCHPALMKAWNGFRAQMIARGYETADASAEVAARVWAKHGEFKGATPNAFCAWCMQILTRWILEELRRRRPDLLGSVSLPIDPNQPRPSQVFRHELEWETYQLAKAALPDHERILIELRYEQELSHSKMRKHLQIDHLNLWSIHQSNWNTDHMLGNGCKQALAHLNRLALKIYQYLEDGIVEHLTADRFFLTEREILEAFPLVSDLSIGFVALHSAICWRLSDDANLVVLGTSTPMVAKGGSFQPIAITPNLGKWSGCGYWKLLAASPDGYEKGALAVLYSPLKSANDLWDLGEADERQLAGAVLFTGDERDRFLEAIN